MDLVMLEGEIVAIEDAIKMEFEFSTFDEDESEIPEISECVAKLEKLKEELVEKMVVQKSEEPTTDQTSSNTILKKVADKVEELKKLKERLNEAIERKERDKRAEKEIEIEKEKSRIAELQRKFEEWKTAITAGAKKKAVEEAAAEKAAEEVVAKAAAAKKKAGGAVAVTTSANKEKIAIAEKKKAEENANVEERAALDKEKIAEKNERAAREKEDVAEKKERAALKKEIAAKRAASKKKIIAEKKEHAALNKENIAEKNERAALENENLAEKKVGATAIAASAKEKAEEKAIIAKRAASDENNVIVAKIKKEEELENGVEGNQNDEKFIVKEHLESKISLELKADEYGKIESEEIAKIAKRGNSEKVAKIAMREKDEKIAKIEKKEKGENIAKIAKKENGEGIAKIAKRENEKEIAKIEKRKNGKEINKIAKPKDDKEDENVKEEDEAKNGKSDDEESDEEEEEKTAEVAKNEDKSSKDESFENIESSEKMNEEEKEEVGVKVMETLEEHFDIHKEKISELFSGHTKRECNDEDEDDMKDEEEMLDYEAMETEKPADEKNMEEEDHSNLERAWEMLELAKNIYSRMVSIPTNIGKLCDTLLAPGEVSIENENYAQAVEDLNSCLGKRKDKLPNDMREIAETQHQLGVALSYHVMDEIDAALDNTNIGKVAEYINTKTGDKKMSVIVISLKEDVYSHADALVGITTDSHQMLYTSCFISKVLILDLTDYDNAVELHNETKLPRQFDPGINGDWSWSRLNLNPAVGNEGLVSNWVEAAGEACTVVESRWRGLERLGTGPQVSGGTAVRLVPNWDKLTVTDTCQHRSCFPQVYALCTHET